MPDRPADSLRGQVREPALRVEPRGALGDDVLAEVAAEEGYIRPEDKARLIAFRNNPSDESWINK